MKTRRKSKATTHTEADQDESQMTEDHTHKIEVEIPDDIDLDSLQHILQDTSLTSHSSESIVSLYRLLLVHVEETDAIRRELEEARAEGEKKDVELDQALQDRESQTKDLETSLDTLQSELKEVKQERDHLASSRNALQAQINSLLMSQSSSSTESDTLRHRIEDTEREKRDLVGVVSRLKEDSAQREEEVQILRTNLKQARQEHQALEAQVRELRSTETSTKFKIDTLTQQLELSKSEAERTSKELNEKTEEFAKYRRSKHSESSQLQAAYDALTETHASTESSFKALQSGHTTQSHQLMQALGKVRDLTGQLAELETTYEREASVLRNLVTAMEEREVKQKESVDAIERDWAGVGERTERREAILMEEIEKEKRAKEDARRKVDQLENILDRVGRGELPVPGRAPATPSRIGTPDLTMDGMMGLSPTVAMASKAQRAGKTFTEVYADYVRLQDDYAKKSAEYDHMDRTLSDVLAQIEERAPILSQQRIEYERLQSEAIQLASQLSQALADRDAHNNHAQETVQKLQKSTLENELLQKQLNDLGRQVQHLLKEISRRDDPAIPSDEDLDQMEPPPAENIEAVITNNLVLFRSTRELQDQNQKLLKIVRELGAKMEAEEQDYRAAMEKEQAEAVKEAHEAMKTLAVQLETQQKSNEIKIQAYMKERDALKSLLARAERSSGASGVSADREVGINGYHEGTLSATQQDMAKELAEIQTQFESYRTEMGIDSMKLRDNVIDAQREAGRLNAALAKANAKIEYLSDRHRMTQEQLTMQSRELDNLTKRNSQLYAQYTLTEIDHNRKLEELSVATSRNEQFRNECANLRAEKKIWETVQNRLVEDNNNLAVERSRLADLTANLQKIHNDLERSGGNDRRRLENQMQMLENQAQDLKTQLVQERDAVRHITLQKDIELKELHARLDRNMEDLSKARESLIGAETSKAHLQQRVEELSRHLQGNEEKLSVYERRSSTVGTVSQGPDNLSQEQQFEAEVAELRSSLKVAEMDLATARNHVQQFQEISQANESALATLNASHDEYMVSTEAQISKHELEYKALQDKLQSVQDEAAQITVRHTEIQHTLENERAAWLSDKKTLEDTIVDMSTSEKHSESDRSLREMEARRQEERANAAEERYSREVLTHAESIKSIEMLKQQLSTAQAKARDNLAATETAQVKLATSENSWKQQKQTLDQEIVDLNTRCKDLSSQNSILHQHLESVSSQAARIQQAADSSATITVGEGETSDDVETKLSELRAVVAYLRKEKEIVDLQLELSKQENVRLKSQIDHLSQSLDETRATLSEERERAVETAASEAQHAEFVERINQLNILKESNATLRSDCERHAKRARELDAKLKQLSAELEPAKEQARVSQAELQARDVHVKRLEAESRRWQERNAQLLSKYDRIDPAEVQSLKDEIEELKSQKTELEASSQGNEEEKQKQIERTKALEENLRKHREQLTKIHSEFRQRWAAASSEKKTIETEKQALETTVSELRQEMQVLAANLNEQLDTLRGEKATLEKTLEIERASKPHISDSEQEPIILTLREERDKLLAEKESWVKSSASGAASNTTLEEAKRLWEIEKAELINARDHASSQVKAATEQAQKAVQDAKNIRLQNEKFQTRIQDMQKARAGDGERASAQQQAAVTAAVDKLRSELQVSSSSAIPDDISQAHAEELRSLRDRLVAEHQKQLEVAVEAAKRELPTSGPGISKAEQQAAIEAAIIAHDKELEPRRQAELQEAMESGRKEADVKGRLKDAQLLRTQTKLKEKEALILGWQNAGFVPKDEKTATPAKPVAAGASSSAPSATPTTPVTNILGKPAAAAGAATPQAGRGARGGARGVTRGVARGLSIRGAAPGRGGAPSPVASGPSGVSIIGAAGKRAREEGDGLADDSLAKRLKPVEGTSKPVAIRRPPPS